MLDWIRGIIAKIYWKYALEYDKKNNSFWAHVVIYSFPKEVTTPSRLIIAELNEKLEYRGSVTWDGNNFQNYEFVTTDDIKEMEKAGICDFP
jgi:hypothetical protein